MAANRKPLPTREQHIGYFDNLQEAETAIKQAREVFHGEFTNHGDN
jgi:hypothetical protein